MTNGDFENTDRERPARKITRELPECKDGPDSSIVAQGSSAADPNTSEATDEVQLMFGDISIPTVSLNCSDLLRMIKGPFKCRHVLEILLVKRQPGSQYLKAALGFLQDITVCLRITEDPNIFQLAEINVPSEERLILTKALLEADLFFDKGSFLNRPTRSLCG